MSHLDLEGGKENPRWKGSYVQHNKVDDLKATEVEAEVEDPRDARWKACYVPAANAKMEKMKV